MEDDPKVLEILKGLTADQKMRAAANLYWAARSLTAAGLRSRHPEWTEDQIRKEVRDVYLYSTT